MRKGPLPVRSVEKDNRSWALTSDRPPPPCRAARGWQEELELYCHPGKSSSWKPAPPFRCVVEAASLFSRGGSVSAEAGGANTETTRRGSGGHCDLTLPLLNTQQ